MAKLTPQKINDFGVISTLAAATAAGDEFDNSGVEFLHVKNGHATATYVVTITARVTNIHHQQFGTVTKSNITKSVLPGQDAFIGPFKQGAFNDANNRVQITYDAVTTLSVAVLYLDQQ
jgi:hypothetical protein|tara:strand:- start:2765 stop:3121 length:357 start_codon:yes stop_codon:yes gene_type:complete